VRAFPFKCKKGEAELPAERTLLNRMLALLQAVAGHPFRIVTRQFDRAKMRYRGLSKSAQQLYLLFALGNLYHARGC
jgi:IS5 family transposase